MRFSTILPLAALSTAFVIPDEQVMNQIAIESRPSSSKSIFDKLPSTDELLDDIENAFSKVAECSKNAFDEAVEQFAEVADTMAEKIEEKSFDTRLWIDSAMGSFDDHHGDHDGHGPHGPRKGHRGPHHPKKGHGKPNITVYELIAGSKYTTKLAGLINEYPDLVELLNGTTANFTVFAPIDKAFDKIPSHGHKPSKEFLENLLTYHVSTDFYPAGRVLVTKTIPTAYTEPLLNGEAQRLSTNIGFRGLTVNFYSRIVAIDIFGTNGVIHGIDSILIPPPNVAKIIELLPGEFSTLDLALTKTGLLAVVNDTSNHLGGTFFAPSNFAFQKLGPRINAFLFSKYGEKYLAALLKYHVVANQTLYSDAFYQADNVKSATIPKGVFHVDLPTLLADHSLSIDVARFGRAITIKINAFSQVTIPDGIASDGVIHVVSNVLVPPKKVGGEMIQWEGEDLTEEELKDRLEPFVTSQEL